MRNVPLTDPVHEYGYVHTSVSAWAGWHAPVLVTIGAKCVLALQATVVLVLELLIGSVTLTTGSVSGCICFGLHCLVHRAWFGTCSADSC